MQPQGYLERGLGIKHLASSRAQKGEKRLKAGLYSLVLCLQWVDADSSGQDRGRWSFAIEITEMP